MFNDFSLFAKSNVAEIADAAPVGIAISDLAANLSRALSNAVTLFGLRIHRLPLLPTFVAVSRSSCASFACSVPEDSSLRTRADRPRPSFCYRGSGSESCYARVVDIDRTEVAYRLEHIRLNRLVPACCTFPSPNSPLQASAR